jgi:hypothetical protein
MSQTRKQLVSKIAVAIAAILWTLFSLSYLIFGVLGKTRSDTAWSHVLALYISLAIATAGLTLKIQLKRQRIGNYLSHTATGAILGFFSCGWLTGESSLWAGVGAVIGALGSLLGSHQAQNKNKQRLWQDLTRLALDAASAIAVYGFGLLVGTNAIALLTTGHLLAGIGWSLLSVYSLWLVVKAAKWREGIGSYSDTNKS